MMLVRDLPLPVALSHPHWQAKIERLGLSVGPRSLAANGRKSKGDIGASGDVHLLNLKANRTARPGEEDVPRLPVNIEPDAFEGGGNIEHHEIGRVASEDSSVILAPHRIRPCF